jgi:hypothetical protein
LLLFCPTFSTMSWLRAEKGGDVEERDQSSWFPKDGKLRYWEFKHREPKQPRRHFPHTTGDTLHTAVGACSWLARVKHCPMLSATCPGHGDQLRWSAQPQSHEGFKLTRWTNRSIYEQDHATNERQSAAVYPTVPRDSRLTRGQSVLYLPIVPVFQFTEPNSFMPLSVGPQIPSTSAYIWVPHRMSAVWRDDAATNRDAHSFTYCPLTGTRRP